MFAALIALSTPAFVNAAQVSRNISGGRTYVFTNGDPRASAYVSIGGGARYDYVIRDSQGEVVDYGLGSGRVQVRNGGSTSVTLNGASQASATYNSSNIAVREASGQALSRISVAGGKTVTFVNNTEKGLFVTIGSASRTEFAEYDCAVFNRFGASQFFMNGCRYTSLFIPYLGRASFTPGKNGMVFTIPTGWNGNELTFIDGDGPSLSEMTLLYGKSYRFVNNGSVECVFDLARGQFLSYEYVMTDEWGYTTGYGVVERLEKFVLGAQANIVITPYRRSTLADDEEGIKLIYPAELQRQFGVTETGNGRLTSYSVPVGGTVSFTNDGDIPFTFRADPAAAASVIDYTYGAASGETRSATDVSFNEMTVAAGFTWTLSVKRGLPLELRIPAAWLSEGISQSGDARPALDEYQLAPGATLIIENEERSQAYEIRFMASQPIHGFAFDYIVETESDLTKRNSSSESALTLPPQGVLAVTNAGKTQMTVSVPSSGLVGARFSTESALVKHALLPGESLYFENAAEEKFYQLIPQHGPETSALVVSTLEYAHKDTDGDFVDYGYIDTNSQILLGPGETALFSNNSGSEVEFIVPVTWLGGLVVAQSGEQALFTRTIIENQPHDIINLDKNYDARFKVLSERNFNSQYDFVSRDDREIVSYGVNGAGYATLYGGGKITVMPRRGSRITVCYPAEWNDDSVKISQVSDAPLYRKVLKPNERLTFNNKNKVSYTVQNSSVNGIGRYYLREGQTNVKLEKDERPVTGAITVGEQKIVTIMAATGADLEIWIPLEWSKFLIR